MQNSRAERSPRLNSLARLFALRPQPFLVWLRRRFGWRSHRIRLVPLSGATADGEGFIQTQQDARLQLSSSHPGLPVEQTLFSFRVSEADVSLLPELYWSDTPESEAVLAHQFPSVRMAHRIRRLVYLPRQVGCLQFGLKGNARFKISDFTVYELGNLPLLITALIFRFKHHLRRPSQVLGLFEHSCEILLRYGPRELFQQLINMHPNNYQDTYAPPPRIVGAQEINTAKAALTAASLVQLNRFLASGQKLNFPAPSTPQVSILIVVYNRAELTLTCLQSVLNNAGENYEVILVDNASTDKTRPMLDQISSVCVLHNTTNLGFVHACNQAAAVARGAYLLLLNNDAQLLPGSLDSALRTIHSSDDIGAVGAKIILPNGKLQEAGSIIWRDGSCLGYGRDDDPDKPMYMFQRSVDYCSGAALLTKKSVWDSLDGFQDVFAPGYYEESDYCERARHLGLRTVYDPNMVILHYEFGSSTQAQHAIALQAEHQRIFLDLHTDRLQSRYHRSEANILLARSADHKPRVLVIDDRVPHGYLGSGFPRANAILHALDALGYAVTFYPKQFPDEDWQQVYTDLPPQIEVMLGYDSQRLKDFLIERQGFYDIILVSRPHNMADFQRIVRAQPGILAGARLIYDAEAIYGLRDLSYRRLRGERVTSSMEHKTIDQELALANGSQAVISVSEHERQNFMDYGHSAVHVLGHSLTVSPTPADFQHRQHLLFVGSMFGVNSPNTDSVVWFVEEILARIQAQIDSQIELQVAGINTVEELTKRLSPGLNGSVKLLGKVNDIVSLYNQSRVFIVPTRFAAGIPHKAHEAAAHGVPLVTTQLIAKQLGWQDEVDLLSADSPDDFARQCVRLYTDEALWRTIRANALQRIATECSPARFVQALQQIVDHA